MPGGHTSLMPPLDLPLVFFILILFQFSLLYTNVAQTIFPLKYSIINTNIFKTNFHFLKVFKVNFFQNIEHNKIQTSLALKMYLLLLLVTLTISGFSKGLITSPVSINHHLSISLYASPFEFFVKRSHPISNT